MSKRNYILPFSLLAVAAFCAPMAPHAYNVAKRHLTVRAALQVAAATPYQGLVAAQKEILNCKLPFTNDKPPLNTRMRAEAPDGSVSDDITFLDGTVKRRTVLRA